MLLSVWRHAEAAPGSPDRGRVLTTRGHADLERGVPAFAAALASRALPAPSQLLYSRWERTRQTAERLAAHWPGLAAKPLEALIPGCSVAQVEAALAEPAVTDDAQTHLVLVSHQPLVSELLNHWLGEEHPDSALEPGAFAVLSLPVVAAGCARLELAASPPEYRAR